LETITKDISLDQKLDELLITLEGQASRADELGETQEIALDAIRKSGYLGCLVPEEFGGMGENVIFASRFLQKVATVDPSIAIIAFQHMSVISRILEWGTDFHKQKYLPLLASGKWIGASAWSEKGAGANKQKLSTVGSYLGNDTWDISGAKTFTTGAGLADLYLVLVQTGNTDNTGIYGNTGQSFFLIETSTPGVKANSKLNLSGMRGSSTGFIELDKCIVDSKSIIGPLGGAPKIISGIRESGLSLGAISVGISQAAYKIAYEHIQNRELQDKELMKFKLSELNMHIEAARALVEFSAQGTHENQKIISYQSKIFASEVSEKVCRDCQQLVGGGGFMRGSNVERFYRDARAVALMGPVNDLAKEIIGRELVM